MDINELLGILLFLTGELLLQKILEEDHYLARSDFGTTDVLLP